MGLEAQYQIHDDDESEATINIVIGARRSMPVSRRTRAVHDKPISKVQKFIVGVLSWQIWLLVKSPYKLIKLGNFQMSITSSKISFGTQFKAHIGANHAARHLRLKKLGNKQKTEKVVQSILTGSTVFEAWM